MADAYVLIRYNHAICNTLQTKLKWDAICYTVYFKPSCQGNAVCNIIQIATNPTIWVIIKDGIHVAYKFFNGKFHLFA